MPPYEEDRGWTLADARVVSTVKELAGVLRTLRRRQARQSKDPQLTYRELAGRTGWARGVIGDYFAGNILPPTDRFDSLIRLLGATPAEQGALATARDRVEELRRSSGFAATPRGLPPDVVGFTGRAKQLVLLTELVRPVNAPGAVPIAALNGAGGTGKSALAVHGAHQLADRFPDGQLYVDLLGSTYGQQPLSPGVVLARFLRALGVGAGDLPASEAEEATLFRAMAADRRLLVVLDNACDAGQVRPLLPASRTCAVVVTSRQVLAALDGATHVHVDVLPPPDAVALLGGLVGRQRLNADRAAAEQVARLCGYLPLALRIAGARLAARPHWPIRALASRLADSDHRLDELEHGDLRVRPSFEAGYRQLVDSGDATDRAAAAAFPLLSLLDGADPSPAAAAWLLGEEAPAAEQSLERLVDARLLETSAPGRYRFHELLRLYARELAVAQYSPEERTAAVTRATSW